MANDPYKPPDAAVADVVPDRLLAGRPRQVASAVFLLWISYALAFPMIFLEFERSAQGVPFGMIALWAVFLAIGAALIVSIWRGANWARIAYMVLFVLSFLGFWFSAAEMLEKSVFEFMLNAVNAGLDGVALYLIFTQPGSLWFRKAAP